MSHLNIQQTKETVHTALSTHLAKKVNSEFIELLFILQQANSSRAEESCFKTKFSPRNPSPFSFLLIEAGFQRLLSLLRHIAGLLTKTKILNVNLFASFLWYEVHGNGVYTMPHILFGELLAQENMPQVCTAIRTLDFRSDTVSIGQPLYGARNLVVKTGPSAICLKLAFGTIKRCATTFAYICSTFPKSVVFACKGRLCSFVYNDLFFFLRQFTMFLFFN